MRKLGRMVFACCVICGVSAWSQQPLPAEGDEDQLLAVLVSDAPLFDKAKACQRLAVIGTGKSVPKLAAYLGDDKLAHYARFGLESNPSADVDQAFRDALDDLSGAALIGVVNSIGVRRDDAAVDALLELADGEDDAIAMAAIAALAKIGSPPSIAGVLESLDGPQSRRGAAADAALTAADVLISEGKNAEAARIFATLGKASLPQHVDIASRLGDLRAGAENTVELMRDYLADEDEERFRIGLVLAHSLQGDEVTTALVNRLKELQPQRKVLLIHVLGGRGDSAALPAVLDAVRDQHGEIRVAATTVLGTLGDASVVPVLIDSAIAGDAESEEALGQAARDSLVELSDPRVDESMTRALDGAKGPPRVVLIEVVGRRGISNSIPSLLRLMTDDDSAVRAAAVDALGLTVGPKELPQMLDRLIAETSSASARSADVPIKDALQKACQRMPDRDAAATVLLDRMAGAPAETKGELLNLLIYVGGETALQGIAEVAKGNDDQLADAATQALGKWLTPDVAPVLLDLAQNGNPKYRVRCLRGYIRVIRQFGLRGGQRLQMSRTALKVATRDDERKLVLDTMTRFPSGQALKTIKPYLSNEALKQEAAKAAVKICESIVTGDPKSVKAILPDVLGAIDDPELKARAKVVQSRAK